MQATSICGFVGPQSDPDSPPAAGECWCPRQLGAPGDVSGVLVSERAERAITMILRPHLGV